MLKCLAAALALLIASGVGAQTERPAWYPDPSVQYPPAEFLFAIGEGKNADEARDRAMEQLSRYFGVKVQTQTKAVQTYAESGGDKARSQLEVSISNKVSTSSKHQLFNVESALPWQRDASNTAVLVFMRKQSSLESWSALEKDLGGRLDAAVARAGNTSLGMGMRFASMLYASDALERMRSLEAMRLLVDPAAPSLLSGEAESRLAAMKPVLLSEGTVRITAATEQARDVVPLVEALLSDAGFLTGPEGQLSLEVRYVLKAQSASYGLGSTAWNLDVKLMDKTATIAATSLSGKASGSNADKAREKADADAMKLFQSRFLPDLVERLARLAE